MAQDLAQVIGFFHKSDLSPKRQMQYCVVQCAHCDDVMYGEASWNMRYGNFSRHLCAIVCPGCTRTSTAWLCRPFELHWAAHVAQRSGPLDSGLFILTDAQWQSMPPIRMGVLGDAPSITDASLHRRWAGIMAEAWPPEARAPDEPTPEETIVLLRQHATIPESTLQDALAQINRDRQRARPAPSVVARPLTTLIWLAGATCEGGNGPRP